jgi:hypothetical protein
MSDFQDFKPPEIQIPKHQKIMFENEMNSAFKNKIDRLKSMEENRKIQNQLTYEKSKTIFGSKEKTPKNAQDVVANEKDGEVNIELN